jgi:hypothetical protein
MCLIVDKAVTRKVRARLRLKGKIEAWKVVGVKILYGPRRRIGWLRSIARSFCWKKGLNYAMVLGCRVKVNRADKWRDGDRVDPGFHVYLSKSKAHGVAREHDYHVPVRVVCYEKDFIAAGYNNRSDGEGAVFSKARVLAADWNDAMEKAKKKVGIT